MKLARAPPRENHPWNASSLLFPRVSLNKFNTRIKRATRNPISGGQLLFPLPNDDDDDDHVSIFPCGNKTERLVSSNKTIPSTQNDIILFVRVWSRTNNRWERRPQWRKLSSRDPIRSPLYCFRPVAFPFPTIFDVSRIYHNVVTYRFQNVG